MRKIKIIIVLMLTGKLLFAQCEYIEDSTALRVIGSASAPSCNSNFTYCSKNGYSISPYGNYRVLNLMINIIYDQTPAADPLAGTSSNYWNPGTTNTVNSNVPSNLNNFMDADFTTIPPQGIFTRKYYESSFGAMHVVGDYVIVDVTQKYVNDLQLLPPASNFSYGPLVRAAIDIINNSGGLSTIYGPPLAQVFGLVPYYQSSSTKSISPLLPQ